MSKSVRRLKQLQQKMFNFHGVDDPVVRQLDLETAGSTWPFPSTRHTFVPIKVRHPDKLVKHRVQSLCHQASGW